MQSHQIGRNDIESILTHIERRIAELHAQSRLTQIQNASYLNGQLYMLMRFLDRDSTLYKEAMRLSELVYPYAKGEPS